MNLELLAYKTVAGLMRRFPDRVVEIASRTIWAAAARFDRERVDQVQRHQIRVRPELADAPQDLDDAVTSVFGTYARYYSDTARLAGLASRHVDAGFSYEGFEHIENGWAAGKGVILVLPHIGGWEWAGSWLTKVPHYKVTAVVEPIPNDELREWMQGWRESIGMDIVPLGPDVGRVALNALREGQILCLMSDRNLGDGGVEVEFFGENTELPGGPAALALRTGAAIVPVAVYHRGKTNHAVVLPPVPAERQGRIRDDVGRITQDIAHRLEHLIRLDPGQWIVMQPNWPSDRALSLPDQAAIDTAATLQPVSRIRKALARETSAVDQTEPPVNEA